MSYPRSELTPVMNLGSDELVLIPLDNFIVTKQGNIRHDEMLNMMVIDGSSYNDLESTLSLPEITEDESKAYFIKRCNDASGYGCAPLSDKAYGIIYNELVDAGDSLKLMLDNMGRILNSFHEDRPEDILSEVDLYEYGGDDQRSGSELLGDALDSVHSNDFQTYYADYMNGDVQVILYSGS